MNPTPQRWSPTLGSCCRCGGGVLLVPGRLLLFSRPPPLPPSLKAPKARNISWEYSGVQRLNTQIPSGPRQEIYIPKGGETCPCHQLLAANSVGSLVPGAKTQHNASSRAAAKGFGWHLGWQQGQNNMSFAQLPSPLLSRFPRRRGQSKNQGPPVGTVHFLWAGGRGEAVPQLMGALGLPAGSVTGLLFTFCPTTVFWSCFISFYFPGRCLESSGQMTWAAGGAGTRG